MEVKVKTSFEHNGTRRAGDKFDVPEHAAKLLKHKGLVEILPGSNADKVVDPADKQDSAAPVAPLDPAKPARRRAAGQA